MLASLSGYRRRLLIEYSSEKTLELQRGLGKLRGKTLDLQSPVCIITEQNIQERNLRTLYRSGSSILNEKKQ